MSHAAITTLKRHGIALIAVGIACALAQILTLSQHPLSSFSNDSGAYMIVAQQISTSWANVIQPLRTPGYPLFVLAIFKLIGSPFPKPYACLTDYIAGCDPLFHPLVLAQALVMTITTFELYILGFRLTHKRWMAAVVAIVAGCNLYVFSWERLNDTETLSYWAIVTFMLLFERYVRRPTVLWGIALSLMAIVAIMIRPFNEFVPIVLIMLVLARALWTHVLTTYWKSAALILVLTYGFLFGYSQLNGRMNGVYDISYVTNINLFGKVLEYRMQDEPVPAQYAKLQTAANIFTSKGGVSPFPLFDQFGSSPQQAAGLPGGHYDVYGAFARYIILHHPLAFALRSLPDLYHAWIISDYGLYPDYGHGVTYAAPADGSSGQRAGITFFDTRNGPVPVGADPIWLDIWLIASTLEELSFGLLPVVTIGILIWIWFDRKSEEAFFLFSLAMLVVLTIGVTAVGSYDQFARLRFPGEWAMFMLNIATALILFDAYRRKSHERSPLAIEAHEGLGANEITVKASAVRPHAMLSSRDVSRIDMSARSALEPSAGIGPAIALSAADGSKDRQADWGVQRTVSQGVRRTLENNTAPGDNASVLNDVSHRTVVLGAGPAGLTAAYELMRSQIPTVTLEKDPRFVGGISRTEEHRGYRFDIGGHRFFSKSQEVEDFWTEILGEELLTRGRLSRIFYQGKYFDYPLKASNALFNMGPIETIRCISSYAWARVRPTRNPTNLEEWVTNQFGHRLFSIFFKTYTEKVWGISTKELSADWAAQRIKGLNLTEAIKGALLPQKKAKGGKGGDRSAVIKTLIDEFRYPKHGPGEMWERVAQRLRAGGNLVAMGQEVVAVRHDGRQVTEVIVRDGATGQTGAVTGAHFLSTLPIRELIHKLEPAPPPQVLAAADQLKYRDFLTIALVVNKPDVFPDNWIYIHDPSVKVGRMQNFKSWSPYMVPDQNTTCIGLEYFCFEGDGLWTATDAQLVELGTREMAQLGLCAPDEVLWGVVVRQPKAYPVYDDVYKQHLSVIRQWIEPALPNLALVGRNGMHHYNNQDHSMMTALLAARNIATGSHFDPWKVNTDAEYHEESRFEDEDTSGRRVPNLARVEK